MPTKATVKKNSTKTGFSNSRTAFTKTWIKQFSNNAGSFGWTKAQINAWANAFSAWEKAFWSLQANGTKKSSSNGTKKFGSKSSYKPSSKSGFKSAKSKSSTSRNYKRSNTRNWKVAA
jgi:hypothetical protein